jgi:hypothetical protein
MASRENINIRLSARARERLVDLGKARGLTRPSDILEAIINEAWGTPADYYAQHAAYQGFIAVAMTSMLLDDHFKGDPEGERKFRHDAARQAAAIFGKPPVRRFEVAGADGEIQDPRLAAILAAYGAPG